ncbi:MAG TPA: FAD-binding oxidoreductase [Alphaproteobacteria bacterium]|nr:FAD-binding oxidoreductase [Alphaproteobacteria bacterium]
MPMKIAVVGGGVIGTSIAWHLAMRKLGEVLLVERDRLGSGTTWHSAGNITWKPLSNHDLAVLYALETIAHLEKDHDRSTGWLKTGRMFIARSDAVRQDFERFDRVAKDKGIGARWLEPGEAQALNPLLDGSKVGAIWFNPLSGRVNPADLTAAYASAARAAGARILENREALRLSLAGGRVSGIDTREGFIEADTVVVASGLWSRGLLAPLGVGLPQVPCEHFYVIANTSPRLNRETPSFVAPDDLIYGREEVGGFLVGFFDENAKTLDPSSLPNPFSFTLLPPDWDKIAPYFEKAVEIFPALEKAPIRHFINGPESFTPDGKPLIGRVPDIDGLVVATAMNSAGVTWSAMTGHIVADMVAGVSPKFDHARYDPMRFGDKGHDIEWLKGQIAGIVSLGYRNQNR